MRYHGCGGCGGRGCGGCGWSGYIIAQQLAAQQLAAQQQAAAWQAAADQAAAEEELAAAVSMQVPPNGMVLPNGVVPNGVVLQNDMMTTPAIMNGMTTVSPNGGAVTSTAGYGYGAMQGGFAQAQLERYVAVRASTGFPVTSIVSPLGFHSKKIRADKIRSVVAHPESFFQGKGIFIPCSVAEHFDVLEIRAGGLCIFTADNGDIPAEVFSTGYLIELPLIMPGQSIRMTVRNHSDKSRWFRAAVHGVKMF